ncbi:MAG: U32 family peptidase [Mucinivorans sp.]
MICNKIELLAPAGTPSIARAAIDAGADAVYIGGPSFSARAAVGNSIEEIEQVCLYAHRFGVKVYLAINTLLFPDEKAAARDMVIAARQVGVDAFIVQDMSLLTMDLPDDIILHASTQCSIRTVDRVAHLERAGFDRVVLERGLSIAQIREISAATSVELECFVHGAICISYSGECYLSEHLTSRSANRGCCAQPCRSLYDLVDGDGKILLHNEPLLSPRDLNLGRRLSELIDAGVRSLKIEGRLKDERYVANTVAYYNQKLIEQGVPRSSRGVSRPEFVPDVDKTFSRGFTEYFFDGRQKGVMSGGVPRGKLMGVVRTVEAGFFTLDRKHELANGDGVVSDRGNGTRINRVDGPRIYLLSTDGIKVGDKIYCNFFKNFVPRSVRKIPISISMSHTDLTLTDTDSNSFSLPLPSDLQPANDQIKAREVLERNLRKSGDTIFEVTAVNISAQTVPFMPIGQINELRRALFGLYAVDMPRHLRREPSGELPQNEPSDALLTTPLCPLYQYGLCLKNNKLALPLTIVNNGHRLAFEPSCGECRLRLRVPGK